MRYDFSERIIPGITKMTFYQTAKGADCGHFYVSLEPPVDYELGIGEQIDIPGNLVASIRGDETTLEITFVCPVNVRLTTGFVNRPGTEQIFKKLQVELVEKEES